MYALKEKGIDMAIASRSPTPDIAKVFLDKLELQSMFVAQVRLCLVPRRIENAKCYFRMMKFKMSKFSWGYLVMSKMLNYFW